MQSKILHEFSYRPPDGQERSLLTSTVFFDSLFLSYMNEALST
jgi:hypothetical protein